MSTRDDLKVVNHALRELVRLQLAGELAPDVAWRERRQMLESVEAAWDGLAEDVGAVARQDEPDRQDGGEETGEVPADGRTMPGSLMEGLSRVRSWRLPLSGLLLLCALATFFYVSSL